MPKPTFFNLPKDKQETLLNTSKKEFSRAPFHEASISNIIKNAEIARGSFYQYFEDKEDLYFYLLSEDSKQNHERFVSAIEENNGDLFDSFIDVFQYMLINAQNDENRKFYKNAFLNMNYKVEHTIMKNFDEEEFNKQFIKINNRINKSNLNIADEHEMIHVMKILMSVTLHNLIRTFVKEISFEKSLHNYTFEIKLLKKGLCKEKSGKL